MASLKEVKDRIDSVKSTKKITSAMKMIATAKLRKSQQAINSFLPYSTKLNEILTNLLASDSSIDSVYAQEREIRKIAIVAFSSNSSLCGGFNANVVKEFSSVASQCAKIVGKENIIVYPFGKKIADFARKSNLAIESNSTFQQITDRPAFPPILQISKELVDKFLSKEIDQIILVYTHFKSMGVQQIKSNVYLPFDLKGAIEKANLDSGASNINQTTDYILEPEKGELLSHLIPKVLASNLFAALLDSNASENAARSLAMQIATDNAEELVGDLTIEYNKNRQAAITNQLLDIIGGASALSK
ncbi:ATP synthase F1 subunit gamma [Dysgonomonas sp. HGC4]|uniref:ATP synthase F1 subunit gamma n=1 Tax=Dysgonomonas sp. HGC4 TaxID=1658009 RepID=UPI00068303B2|nr:ATP synthase F1 subunit gamma [Dysgonomonas sp. HGC4]MBD8347498.1 ATP synthase F1 subunit gamma [Dysgonomonas sp. HGC4]